MVTEYVVERQEQTDGGRDAARAQILTAYTFSQLSTLVSLSLEQIVERVGADRNELERAPERLSIAISTFPIPPRCGSSFAVST